MTKLLKLIIVALFFIDLFLINLVTYLRSSNEMEVCFLNVGQGDAILIHRYPFVQVLIDGGPDDTILYKLRKHLPFFDRTIEAIILTHPQQDHLTGLLEVLKYYQVKNIVVTGVKSKSFLFQQWEKELQNSQAKIYFAKQGLTFQFSKNTWLKILYPFNFLQKEFYKDLNNTSIVATLNLRGHKFLFTGDISSKVEKQLLDHFESLNVEILKIAHHGSKYSTSDEFLAKALPEWAIISAGKNNRYHFPHKETLKRLKKYDIKVLTTIKNGDICFIQKKRKPFLSLSPTVLKGD